MAFAGTTQKCRACGLTVYLVDRLAADNRIYHKACFRCHHCNGTLKASVATINIPKLVKVRIFFEGTPKVLKPEKTLENENASKVSSMFGGTRDKCVGCSNTVYPIEKVTVNGRAYHKSCFKCTHGGCTISPSNYIAHEGKLYCKHHHIQLFKAKGNYSQLETELEKDQAIPTPLEVTAEL
ncbi:hypothetical protein F511_01596 [Dorcoceras hygrometricum]|nr:hypothetical protein F511_01596 [Dorcoceras hygrometricum]